MSEVGKFKDALLEDILSWYNASKRAERKDDPYWKGYQDAMNDVLESILDSYDRRTGQSDL